MNVLPNGVKIKKYRGHLHNNFLHLSVERGLPAVISWFLIWILFFFKAIRNYQENKKNPILNLSAVAGIVSISGFITLLLSKSIFVIFTSISLLDITVAI